MSEVRTLQFVQCIEHGQVDSSRVGMCYLCELERLRDERDGLKEMNAHLNRGNLALSAVEHKLTAECERLKSDLTSKDPMHMDSAGRWESAAMRYAHERDRLTRIHDEDSAELRRMDERADKLSAKNDRLRAALERITNLQGKRSDQLLMDALSISNEALHGAGEKAIPFHLHPDYCEEHGGHLRGSPACELALQRGAEEKT